MTPWTTVIQQWTLPGLFDRADEATLRLLVSSTSIADREAKIQSAGLNRMTAYYRQVLMQRFITMYPDTLEDMTLAYTRHIERTKEFSNYASKVSNAKEAVPQTPVLGSMTLAAYPPDSSLVVPVNGIYGYVANVRPRLFFFSSDGTPIDSSLLAGAADPGDFAGDTFAEMLYTNHGTKATPTWVRADSTGLIDFITNPLEILECGYQRALYFIKCYAVDGNDSEFEFRITTLPGAATVKMKEVKELEDAAFQLLQVDTSANGIITDASRRAGRVRKWTF